jgi:hypothetical protein
MLSPQDPEGNVCVVVSFSGRISCSLCMSGYCISSSTFNFLGTHCVVTRTLWEKFVLDPFYSMTHARSLLAVMCVWVCVYSFGFYLSQTSYFDIMWNEELFKLWKWKTHSGSTLPSDQSSCHYISKCVYMGFMSM